MRDNQEIYIANHLKAGGAVVSLADLDATLTRLRYRRIDKIPQYQDGAAVEIWECEESDTHLSPFHYRDARRDSGFKEFQAIRFGTIAVHGNRIILL